MNDEDIYLQHHGIIGMKWGVQRTPAQLGYRYNASTGAKKAKKISEEARVKAAKLKLKGKYDAKVARAQTKADAKIAKAKGATASEKKTSVATEQTKPKSIHEMSNAEIQAKIDRIKLEQNLASLQPKQTSKGKAFVDSAVKKVAIPAVENAAKTLLAKAIIKKGDEILGKGKTKEAAKEVKKEVKDAKKEVQDALNKAVDRDLENRIKEAEDNANNNNNNKTVEGEGTSKTTYDRYDKSNVVDADFVDVTFKETNETPVNSTALVPYAKSGKSFVDSLFGR